MELVQSWLWIEIDLAGDFPDRLGVLPLSEVDERLVMRPVCQPLLENSFELTLDRAAWPRRKPPPWGGLRRRTDAAQETSGTVESHGISRVA